MAALSVVVPAYNAGAHLKTAVDSLRAQRLEGLEIVVVDDGSTDGSTGAVAGPGVKLVRQTNRGEAAARNAGVKNSSAPYVTFLDADDVLSPGALASRLEFLSANAGESVCGGLPSRLIASDGAVVAPVFERMAAKYRFPFVLTDEFYRKGSFFPVSCSLYMYRRDFLDRVGLYDETLPVAPDCDYHFRVLKAASIPVLRVPVFDRRLHASNLSLTGAGRSTAFRPEILETVRAINRRHGFDPKEIVPWELDYL